MNKRALSALQIIIGIVVIAISIMNMISFSPANFSISSSYDLPILLIGISILMTGIYSKKK
ncbi:hypothetical protein AUJ84_00065 [Candidatus Pacearchaeota archaeon CG1_02_32_132]|nr:MAG: hypothetical protein AUJ84_00065 [Candidatus Pacearchaeota archaeon CG1_02_32_132]